MLFLFFGHPSLGAVGRRFRAKYIQRNEVGLFILGAGGGNKK